jgi:tRNA G10  N-methylase Trm11
VCPEPHDFEHIGFRVMESFVMRVHKSLDRHIYILSR